MDVLILAAGQGTRLAPLTNDLPKCLLKIANDETVLSHQLNNLINFGAKSVKIVTGFKHELVSEEVKKFANQLDISLIFNDQFANKNNLYSLWLAQDKIQDDLIIINGDNVFDWEILNNLKFDPSYHGCLLANHKDKFDTDDMLIVENNNTLQQVSKSIPVDQATGESIGIMYFSKVGFAALKNILNEIVEQDPEAAKRWYLYAVEKLAQKYGKVQVSFIGDEYWGEIDYIEDLNHVIDHFRRSS